MIIAGTPEHVAETIKTEVLDAGIDGITINMPLTGYEAGKLTAVGEALHPLVS